MDRRTANGLIAWGLTRLTGIAQGLPPTAQAWQGQLLLRSNWRFLEGQSGPDGLKVDQPQQRSQFGNFKANGNNLQWTLSRGAAVVRFEGNRAGNVIRGRAEEEGVTGEFQLVQTDVSGSPNAAGLVGTYRSGRGDLFSVARFDFGDKIDRLALMDTREGHWGTLLPLGGARFALAPSRSGRFPMDVTFTFSAGANGTASVLTVQDGNRTVTAERMVAYETRPVEFDSGSVHLAGEIILPVGNGKHPGIVMVHSSGNQSRNGPVAYFRLVANLLAAQGFAVLIFDKRGVGGSTGNWQSASLQDLAGDVSAAVKALRTEPRVDPERVGLWTLSQGGWIAPIVAAEDSRIAFLTLVSAAAITPAQQEIDRVTMVMRANGSAQRDVGAARAYLRTFFGVVMKTTPWAELQKAMDQTRSENWLQYVSRPQNERQLGWATEWAGFDPQPLLRNIRVPLLTIHGEDDVDVEASANSKIYRAVATHARSRQLILEQSDHYMLRRIRNPDTERRQLSSDYLKNLFAWLSPIK